MNTYRALYMAAKAGCAEVFPHPKKNFIYFLLGSKQ